MKNLFFETIKEISGSFVLICQPFLETKLAQYRRKILHFFENLMIWIKFCIKKKVKHTVNVFIFSQDVLFGTTIKKYIPPLKVQYARKIMYIHQIACFRQAQTEITKAATNFKKSAGKFAYAKPLYNNHGFNRSANIWRACPPPVSDIPANKPNWQSRD